MMKSLEGAPSLGVGGNEFASLPRAITTEDIFKSMKAGKWRGTAPVRSALEILFNAPHIEHFNFGPLSLETIRETQVEAMEFLEYGCLQLPFPECVFRCSIGFDNRTVGFHLFCVSKESQFAGVGPHDGRVAVLGTIHSDTHVLTFRSDHMMRCIQRPEGRAVEVNIPTEEIRFWEPYIGRIGRGPYIDSNGEVLTEGALIAMGLIMILNTKGVLKERTAPPEKPNKVRAKRGLPLLTYTTRVYTSVYNKAVEKGPAGTHASPRPHRRRAHVRHYPATGYREAYVKPIAAMLVNWDGQPLPDRAEYTVK